MNTAGSKKTGRIILVFLIILALLWVSPIWLILSNSLKSLIEIYKNPLGAPIDVQFNNYVETLEALNYPKALMNSVLVAAIAEIMLVFFGSAAAYKLARVQTRLSKAIFYLLIITMLVPFQVIMIPLYKMINDLNLNNNIFALSFVYMGLNLPLAIFLFHGSIQSIPREMDEAALMDGCNDFQIYCKIIIPMLIPCTITVVVLSLITIWNEYFIATLMIGDKDMYTLPLFAMNFVSKYLKKWNLQLPAIVLSALPIVVFYFGMQKHVVKGISDGAIKG